MNEIIGKIQNPKILKEGRRGKNGLVIEFETDKNITNSSVVQVHYNDEVRPFNVKEVEISGEKLLGRAIECGYWARKLDRRENLDLRTLIGCDVELVTDPKRLSQINEESCWC